MCSSFVNFSVPLPPCDDPKLVPLFEFRAFNPASVVVSVLRGVDRFYRPRIAFRRKFTLSGVEKYYPTRESKLNPQNSFLYKNNEGRKAVYKICEDFILGECFSAYSEAFGCDYRKGVSDTFYLLNFPNNLRLRSKKRSGARCGSNLFPPVSSNLVSFLPH